MIHIPLSRSGQSLNAENQWMRAYWWSPLSTVKEKKRSTCTTRRPPTPWSKLRLLETKIQLYHGPGIWNFSPVPGQHNSYCFVVYPCSYGWVAWGTKNCTILITSDIYQYPIKLILCLFHAYHMSSCLFTYHTYLDTYLDTYLAQEDPGLFYVLFGTYCRLFHLFALIK